MLLFDGLHNLFLFTDHDHWPAPAGNYLFKFFAWLIKLDDYNANAAFGSG